MPNSLTVPPQPERDLRARDVYALADAWLEALDLRVQAGELAATTITTYKAGLGRFIDWCYENQVHQVTADTVRNWKADLTAAEYQASTVNTWLSAVRAFFSWAAAERYLEYNPLAGVPGARRSGTRQSHRRSALTDQEIRRVLDLPERDTPISFRDYAILTLMAYTGARSIEVHRANLADIVTQSGRLVLKVQGKGRQEADDLLVLANPIVENAMLSWLTVRGRRGGPLFISYSNRSKNERLSLRAIRGLVKRYFSLAGVHGSDKTTHSLRHTAISKAVKRGAPLPKVQRMARHASPETTMIYYHEIDRVENPAEEFIDYDE